MEFLVNDFFRSAIPPKSVYLMTINEFCLLTMLVFDKAQTIGCQCSLQTCVLLTKGVFSSFPHDCLGEM